MSKKEQRLEILVGNKGIEKLKKSKVVVFGLGGVGSFAVEALTRSFIGKIDIVDFDIVDISNINRQIEATLNTVGLKKTEVMKNRMLEINDELDIKEYDVKLNFSNIKEFNLKQYDYVVDAIDDIEAKIALIEYCYINKINIISSMGMANKMEPEKIKISKLKNTKSCAIARKLRDKFRNTSIMNLDVVYSEEIAIKHNQQFLGSTSFNPPVAGLFIASFIVKQILKKS